MRLIKEEQGIKLLEHEGKYYLEYDAGHFAVEYRRIEISKEEAELCRYMGSEMYTTILSYQNNGIYGEKI